jgi:hypothetical protein
MHRYGSLVLSKRHLRTKIWQNKTRGAEALRVRLVLFARSKSQRIAALYKAGGSLRHEPAGFLFSLIIGVQALNVNNQQVLDTPILWSIGREISISKRLLGNGYL